jgi:hypothetical protein
MPVEDWLSRMQSFLQLGNCAENALVGAAATYLLGSAARFWWRERARLGREPTWDDFAAAMKRRYTFPGRTRRVRAKW